MEKNKTIAILGTSKENEYVKPYMDLSKKLSYELSKNGYNVITGGAKGINYSANFGASTADSEKSWVIDADIVGIDFEQFSSSGQKLYNILNKTNTGCERTSLMCNLSKVIICFPGGMGTIEEIGVTLENMYYNINSPNDKIFLIGDFYYPLIKLTENMVKYGLINKDIIDRIIYLPFDYDKKPDLDKFTDKIIRLI